MRTAISFLLFCITVVSSAYADTIFDKMSELKEKDFIVFDLYRSVAAIEVTNVSPTSIEFQVAIAAKDILEKTECSSYSEWRKKGYPVSEVHETIHIHKDQSIDPTPILDEIKWLPTLLKLPINKVPKDARKKHGEALREGEIDIRPVWNPPIIVKGEKLKTTSDAFSTKWPDDGSFLSGKTLILYFPLDSHALRSFPHWIESPSSSVHFEVIESERERP